MCIFSFTSARYPDHLCMVTTAWVFPAIQSHTKALHRDSFSPASRQLYSTHPDNNSQPGAFILYSGTRTSPYPESTQVKVRRSTQILCFEFHLDTYPLFPRCGFPPGISDIWSVHRLVPPTGMEGLFIRSLNWMSVLPCCSKQIYKEDGFSHSLHW